MALFLGAAAGNISWKQNLPSLECRNPEAYQKQHSVSSDEVQSDSVSQKPQVLHSNNRRLTVNMVKYFEDEIISCLRPEDLYRFVALLFQYRIITIDIKRNIDIMHREVSHERKCRYILLHAYEDLEANNLCDYFLKLLETNFSTFDKVISRILEYCEDTKSTSSSDVALSVEFHLPLLFSNLAKISFKWKDIARVLIRDSNAIQKINIEDLDLNSCLYNVLKLWLSDTKKECPPPMLSTLVKVLSSAAVCSRREALDLQEEFLKRVATQNTSMLNDNRFESVKSVVLDGIGEVAESDYDDEVAILLEVKFNQNIPVRYRWYREDTLLSDTHDRVACVKMKDITTEATFKCQCITRTGRFDSNHIVIHYKTPVDKYINVLVNRYKSDPEVLADTWPVVKQNIYINLATISDKDAIATSNLTCSALRGDVDDILLAKGHTDYKSNFLSITQGSRIIIEGRPGSGKTTLVHRISQDWAKGHVKWLSVRLLFLVYLRGFRSNPSVTLRDIISKYYKHDADVDILCSYAKKHQGLGYCFVLDGLDEYQPNTRDNFIIKLIEKDELARAVVIISSRPAAVADYRRIADKEIEVLGFFKEQIQEYIQSYKFSSKSRNLGLINYLDKHENVYHMCELPIHSAMICFLFEEDGCLPSTETQIYMEFARHAILRTMYRQVGKKKKCLKSIWSLEGHYRNNFLNICKLAFEKTLTSVQILEHIEVKKLCKDMNIEDSLGLITMDIKATKCGFQKIYTFCHLTFQEFLAACHISFQTEEKQLEIFQSHGTIYHMQVVFKFFLDLLNLMQTVVNSRLS